MAKATFSADSASFPTLISPAIAELQPPPDGTRGRLMAVHSAPLTAPTRN